MSTATLFNLLIEHLGLKNDAALARYLDTDAPVISKMRSSKKPMSCPLLVRIHEETGWPTKKIKAIIAEEP